MWSCNLRFTSKVTADGDGVFFVDAYVPITFEFESDYENAKINIRIRNLDSLGSDRVTFEPHRINDELMEEMAKMIVRKDNRFQAIWSRKKPACGCAISSRRRSISVRSRRPAPGRRSGPRKKAVCCAPSSRISAPQAPGLKH